MMTEITAPVLRHKLYYDIASGIFRWVNSDRAGWKDKVAGAIDTHGYRQIGIGDKYYSAHRLAVLYVTGAWPAAQIDHIDGNRDNNAYSNLRLCTQSENQQNQCIRADNTSGLIGVSWNAQRNMWRADIALRGKRKFLGHRDTKEDAYDLYLAAKAEMHTFQPIPRAA